MVRITEPLDIPPPALYFRSPMISFAPFGFDYGYRTYS